MGLNIALNKTENLTTGENKVLESLKKVYKNVEHDVCVYVQCQLGSKRPDFIVLDIKRGILILEVKDWSEDYIKDVNKRKIELLDMVCDNPIMQVTGYKNILSSSLFSRNFEEIDEEDIHIGIIFSNMSSEIRQEERFNLLFKDNINYVFKKDLSNLDIDSLFANHNVNYSSGEINKIRVALFPEIEIITLENKEANLKVLDFEQEEFAKKIPFGNYMVTGVPGSGKTVMLLARAIHLIKENPKWRVLILTYNKSLSYKLESKLDRLAQNFKEDINTKDINIDNIEVKSFHSETSRLAVGYCKPDNMKWDNWFNEEVVKIATRNVVPIYDAILIDEYQDFRMSWIELCVKLCKEYEFGKDNRKVKNIFLAGDRLQSIYNNKDVSWKSIGIDMRGRSKLLKTSYRSAKEHMSLALDFLKQNKILKAEVEKFYKDDSGNDDLEAINNGSIEYIQGNLEFIGEKIVELKAKGYKNEDFLILAASKKRCEEIKKQSPNSVKYQMEFVKDLDGNNIQNNIVLTTYHSSKGLEAKIVFLTSIGEIYNGNDINNQLKRKSVYVGITRASEKLYIIKIPLEKNILIDELESLIENKKNNKTIETECAFKRVEVVKDDELFGIDDFDDIDDIDDFDDSESFYEEELDAFGASRVGQHYPEWLGGDVSEEEFWETSDY